MQHRVQSNGKKTSRACINTRLSSPFLSSFPLFSACHAVPGDIGYRPLEFDEQKCRGRVLRTKNGRFRKMRGEEMRGRLDISDNDRRKIGNLVMSRSRSSI
jgi:hypothetical protein